MSLAAKKVLVAMSGGVDSSVAALLLKEQGYEVIGVTFQLYDYSRQNRKEGKGGCCSLEDVQDAKWVCHKLGIPHYLFDSRERFQKRVMDYFAESYRAGKTPNPCVACNTFIKFDELAYYADSVGAEFYATGHYARLERDEKNRPFLRRAVDPQKDQTYFLSGVAKDHLERCLFPVGEFSKEKIRDFATQAGLPVSQKPDSMEVCFVPENNYRKFLTENYQFEDRIGDVVDEAGNILSQHRGIHHFTVGQGKGLGALGLTRHYVVRLDAEKNQVVVGHDRALYAAGFNMDISNFHEIAEYLDSPIELKIRSRAEPVPAKIVGMEDTLALLEFEEPQRAVTPGQFAVLYQGEKVLGGGAILRSFHELSAQKRERKVS